MIALIIAAIVAGVFAYAAIGFYVAGAVQRRESTPTHDAAVEGLLGGFFWPVTAVLQGVWRIFGRSLLRFYYLARMSPEERRFAKEERRKHREQRVELARAVARRK